MQIFSSIGALEGGLRASNKTHTQKSRVLFDFFHDQTTIQVHQRVVVHPNNILSVTGQVVYAHFQSWVRTRLDSIFKNIKISARLELDWYLGLGLTLEIFKYERKINLFELIKGDSKKYKVL